MSEQWLEVTLAVPARELERVCDVLTANGMAGLAVEEEGEFLRFLEQNRQYWDYVDEDLARHMKGASRVKFYVPDSEEGRRQMAAYLIGLEGYEPHTVSLREEDWATSWQKHYQPIPVGRRLYIVPEWMRGQPVPDGRAPLYLNPGLTFGTGAHATTQLCLELLEQALIPGGQVLDLGCGSGVLAIAALALGAEHAIGVDIDPKAVDVAYENAALNGVGPDRLTVYAGDVLGDGALAQRLEPGRSQVVLANIVADVIIPLSAVVERFLAPEGVFLASGIIDTRADEVAAALADNGLAVTRRLERAGWCAFQARRAGGETTARLH
ncbi:MAG TPA: 50S ribosomal protein L11 methyltransferase [Candidatus Enterenecus merdae]|nr:50S ribosomal protein L11 methyltransferase [Candidatus Enterenecus merdae]